MLGEIASRLPGSTCHRLELEDGRLFVTWVIGQCMPRVGLDDIDLDRSTDDLATEILDLYEARKDDPLWTRPPCATPVKDAVVR